MKKKKETPRHRNKKKILRPGMQYSPHSSYLSCNNLKVFQTLELHTNMSHQPSFPAKQNPNEEEPQTYKKMIIITAKDYICFIPLPNRKKVSNWQY